MKVPGTSGLVSLPSDCSSAVHEKEQRPTQCFKSLSSVPDEQSTILVTNLSGSVSQEH
jgi:hypothetical protein